MGVSDEQLVKVLAASNESEQAAAVPLCVSGGPPVSSCILCSDEAHGLFLTQAPF